jgi:hypothetical protein
MTYYIGDDMPGDDITNAVLANYSLCCAYCLGYSGCVGLVWGLPTAGSTANKCFLKSGHPALLANPDIVTAHF